MISRPDWVFCKSCGRLRMYVDLDYVCLGCRQDDRDLASLIARYPFLREVLDRLRRRKYVGPAKNNGHRRGLFT